MIRATHQYNNLVWLNHAHAHTSEERSGLASVGASWTGINGGVDRAVEVGRLQVDHVVSEHAGGSTWDESNLQALCRGCHIAKTSRENSRPPVSRIRLDWRAVSPMQAGMGYTASFLASFAVGKSIHPHPASE